MSAMSKRVRPGLAGLADTPEAQRALCGFAVVSGSSYNGLVTSASILDETCV